MATDKSQKTIKILSNIEANIISEPIFVGAAKNIEFSIVTDSAANFSIRVISSLQELPPAPASALSADNDFSYPEYYDITDDNAKYNNTDGLFNPSASQVNKTFRVNTVAARWLYIQVLNYSAGELLVSNVSLADNQ